MIYFGILFFYFFTAIIYDGHKKNHFYLFVFEGLLLICLAGFRNYVGGDTMGYMIEYEYVPNLQNLTLSDFVLSRYGPGWILYWSFCKTITSEFWFLQLTHALIVNTVVIWFINKYCPHYKFTVLLFYYFFFFFRENMEVLREAIATSIFLIAFPYLMRKTIKGYVVYASLMLFATLFHSYAALWLFLPLLLPFLARKIELRRILVAVGILYLIVYTPIVNIFVQIGLVKEAGLHKYLSIYTYSSWTAVIYSAFFCLLYYSLLKRCEKFNILPKSILLGGRLFVYMNFLGLAFPVISTRLINYVNLIFYIVIAYALFNLPIKMRMFKYTFLFLICFSRVYSMTSDVTSWTYDYGTSKKYYYYQRYFPYYSIWEDVPYDVYASRSAIAAQQRKNDLDRDQ